MSLNIAEVIGSNIKKYREEHKMSQNDLSEKINTARPVISNWENGKSEPSSSQLVKLAKIFKISTDEIVGNTSERHKVVVVDTSALLKRPSITDELTDIFDEVIIPSVVISELNYQKDKGKPSIKQKAWLVMNSINEKKSSFKIEENIKEAGINDEKIADIARHRAKSKPFDEVYLLTNDILFQFLTKGINNLKAITPAEYMVQFLIAEKNFDTLKSLEFYRLVSNRKIDEVKKYIMEEVNINITNPDDGMTPLISAVRNRDIEMIKHLLLLKEIDLDAKDKHKYGFSAVHHATQLKNMELIKLLVNAGADFDSGSIGRNQGNTPLMVAAWSGFYEAIEYYIAHGACLNQQDSNGFTPLIKACIKHDLKAINLLIENSDKKIRSRENKTAVQFIKPDNMSCNEIVSVFKKYIGQESNDD